MNQKELIIHLHYIAANKKRKRKTKIKLFSSSQRIIALCIIWNMIIFQEGYKASTLLEHLTFF